MNLQKNEQLAENERQRLMWYEQWRYCYDEWSGILITRICTRSFQPRENYTEEKDEIFEFDSIFDVLFDSDRIAMTREGLTQESIALH